MSAHKYSGNSSNSFFALEDDDVDDATFLQNSRVNYRNNPYDERSTLEDKRLQLLERKKEIEQRTLQSSNRSIGLLRESEQIGVATAEELLRQREQLERTEKRLDDINTSLRFSQKHIQGIKSVFGSLKNYLSGKSGEPPPLGKSKPDDATPGNSSNFKPLASTIDQTRTSTSHPGMLVRGLTEDTWEEVPKQSQMCDVQKVIDNNLEEMCDYLTRLKGQAADLGEEIESQNDLLDDIVYKTEQADVTIQKQNKEMGRILKK